VKTTKKKQAFLLAMIMSICVLAACSGNNESNYFADTQDVSDAEESNDSTFVIEDVIGQVNYVDETYFSVTAFEPQGQVTDYATLDISTLSEIDDMDFVYLDETTEYYRVTDGVWESAGADEILVGSFVAVTTGEDGNQDVLILSDPEVESIEDEKLKEDEIQEDETYDHAAESPLIAQLTAFNDDGTLLLTYCSLSEDAADYMITDYTAVETDNYVLSEETEDYTISIDAWIYLIKDGIATEIEKADLMETDILVIYTDENGQEYIYAYPVLAE